MTVELQRPGAFPWSLELTEEEAPAGHQDEAIGHAVHAGRDELGAEAARAGDFLNEGFLNCFFFHQKIPFFQVRQDLAPPAVRRSSSSRLFEVFETHPPQGFEHFEQCPERCLKAVPRKGFEHREGSSERALYGLDVPNQQRLHLAL